MLFRSIVAVFRVCYALVQLMSGARRPKNLWGIRMKVAVKSTHFQPQRRALTPCKCWYHLECSQCNTISTKSLMLWREEITHGNSMAKSSWWAVRVATKASGDFLNESGCEVHARSTPGASTHSLQMLIPFRMLAIPYHIYWMSPAAKIRENSV